MRTQLTLIFCLCLSLFMPYYATGGGDMGLTVSSADFKEGGRIPKANTCEGSDTSPAVQWEDAPAATKSFALIVEDPDAPMGTFIHWVVYDIPASSKGLLRGAGSGPELPPGAKHGSTGFGPNRYNGPCPPKGHGDHRYYFILRALDKETLGLKEGASRAVVERAMLGHILAEAKTMGVYER